MLMATRPSVVLDVGDTILIKPFQCKTLFDNVGGGRINDKLSFELAPVRCHSLST